MSNAGTENLMQHIIDAVDDVWVLYDRDDLKNDCISYVYKEYNWTSNIQRVFKHHTKHFHLIALVVEFLSMKCADALSTADLESMARAEEESKVSSYQEADQGE